MLLAVTSLGDLAGRAPVLRSGAVPGDLVAVAGLLGRAAAGLALLTAGLDGPLADAHRHPEPPYDAGPEAARLGATAMIDTSDGLLADLGHIADASGAGIDLVSARLRPPDDLLAAARAVAAKTSWGRTERGSSPPSAEAPSALAPFSVALSWVLTGGEDHALAATFPPGTALPPRWRVIGQVRPGLSNQLGMLVDGQPWAGAGGWDHFAL